MNHTGVPAIKRVHQAFEAEWAKLHMIYGAMLSTRTLKIAKGIARNAYIQGRIDAMNEEMRHAPRS